MFHPEFERAEFRDDRFDLHRHDLACGSIGRAGSSTSSRLVSSNSRSASGRIWPGVSPLRTADEKNWNSAAWPVTRPNVPTLNQQFSPLLHPLRHDTERLHRRAEPGIAGIELSRPM